MVPLQARQDRSSGQTTYVNGMALGKAIVITDTAGVRDYVRPVRPACLCRPVMLRLWPGRSSGYSTIRARDNDLTAGSRARARGALADHLCPDAPGRRRRCRGPRLQLTDRCPVPGCRPRDALTARWTIPGPATRVLDRRRRPSPPGGRADSVAEMAHEPVNDMIPLQLLTHARVAGPPHPSGCLGIGKELGQGFRQRLRVGSRY